MQSFDKFTLDSVLSGKWWEVLGVDQSDNANVLKLAYIRLVRQYHPDVNSSANAKASMQAINQAYKEFQEQLNADKCQ
nr:DnaJ domain-containing protein [uncultured Nostoc sp.]